MNVQQTIDDLEQQAKQYLEAADALRALLPAQPQGATTAQPAAARSGRPPQAKAANASGAGASTSKGNSGKTKQKRTMSPEARAKISAAVTARHAQRKAEGGG